MNKQFTHILAVQTWDHNYGQYKGFTLTEMWQRVDGSGRVYWENKKDNSTDQKWNPPTRGIKLTCQTGGFSEKNMYAFKCESSSEFDLNHLDEAQEAVKRLKRISAKLDELQKKYGYAKTFSEYAAYIADAIGAEFAEYDPAMDTYRYLDVESLSYKERQLTDE